MPRPGSPIRAVTGHLGTGPPKAARGRPSEAPRPPVGWSTSRPGARRGGGGPGRGGSFPPRQRAEVSKLHLNVVARRGDELRGEEVEPYGRLQSRQPL